MWKFSKKKTVGLHLAQRISFAMQRKVECFNIINKSKERVNNTPKWQQRLYVLTTLKHWNNTGTTLEQHWGPLAAAAGCHCQGVPFNRQEASVPPTNAGQVLKEYSKSQGVDTNVFEKQTSTF